MNDTHWVACTKKTLEKFLFHKKVLFFFFTLNYSFHLLLNELGLSNVQFFHCLFLCPSMENPQIVRICRHTSEMLFNDIKYANIFNKLSALQSLSLINMQHCILFSHLTAICLCVFDAHHMSSLLFKIPAHPHTPTVTQTLPHTSLRYWMHYN